MVRTSICVAWAFDSKRIRSLCDLLRIPRVIIDGNAKLKTRFFTKKIHSYSKKLSFLTFFYFVTYYIVQYNNSVIPFMLCYTKEETLYIWGQNNFISGLSFQKSIMSVDLKNQYSVDSR